MKERLMDLMHYKRNKQAYEGRFGDGNSLCYRGEKDGHFQEQETPLIEGNIRTLFSEQIFPSPFNAGEIIRRNHLSGMSPRMKERHEAWKKWAEEPDNIK